MEDYITRCMDALPGSRGEKYLRARGFSDEILKEYRLGYDAREKAVSIPYPGTDGYYTLRYIEKGTKEDNKYYKPKDKTEPLFIAGDPAADVAFYFEGQLNALSLVQAGAPCAAAIGGSGAGKLARAKLPKAGIVVADNDEAGERTAQSIFEMLERQEIPAVIVHPPEPYNDSNDVLKDSPEKLAALVKEWMKLKLPEVKGKKLNEELQELEGERLTDLMEADIPPVEWIVDGILPVGCGMIAAPPKSYKSFAVLDLGMCIAEGMDFLGFKTYKSSVLYLDLESNRRRPRDRARMILKGKPIPENLIIMTKQRKDGKKQKFARLGKGFEAQLLMYLDKNPGIKLVIIDVFQKIKPLGRSNQNLYEADYEALEGLTEISSLRNVGVLLVHHTRKMRDPDDVFNQLSGSTGIMGSLDYVWMLSRKDRFAAEATFSITGRDVESQQYKVQWDPDDMRWRMLGDSEKVERDRIRKAYEQDPVIRTIKKALEMNKGHWEGTAADLISVSKYWDAHIYETAEKVGKTIQKYAPLLLQDGIEWTQDRASSAKRERIHKFNDLLS